MIDCDEEGFGVASEEKIEENNRSQDNGKQPADGWMDGEIQCQIDDDTEHTACAIINHPSRGKKVTGFTLVRIAAAWTSIQG